MEMNEKEIMALLKSEITIPLIWSIGVTNNPGKEKEDRGNPEYWRQWEADDEMTARRIERHLLDNGCKKAWSNGNSHDARHIYAF